MPTGGGTAGGWFSEGRVLLLAMRGDFCWPPAGTSHGHQRRLFHGHGQADDPSRLVPNPARRKADKEVRRARAEIASAEAEEGRAALLGMATDNDVAQAFAEARAELARLEQQARAIPSKLALSKVRPGAARVDDERKRIHDAVRMAVYNAESALARLLAPHYARAEDEARSLLREAYKSPGDLEVVERQLHVRLSPLSSHRRTRALAALCEALSATETLYPGTDLVLVYSVKEQ
ncbi:MAG: hypothetical protein M0Z69_15300 [Actinomycetota bacterium]|nr:hypothetical protein [Actinomycetota bacterium]